MGKQEIIILRHEILIRYLNQYPHALFDWAIWQSWVDDYLLNPNDASYTPSSLAQQFKNIFIRHDPRMPSQKLADFFVNPLFMYYSQHSMKLPESYIQSAQSLSQDFQVKLAEAVACFAEDIYQHSARYFSELTASELGEQTEAYKKITQFFNALNLYVQQDILRGGDVNRQCFLIQFWLELVEKVLLLGDISSAMSITAALNSTAIQKLSKARQGLSEAQHARLESLSLLLSLETLRYQQDELLKKYERPIPYLGIYRTRYDVEKTKKNISAQQNIIHAIEQLQDQISFDTHLPLPSLPFSLDEAVSERYAICTDQLEKIAKQYDQDSQAAHQKLSQIQSARLRDFFLLKRWDPNPDVYVSWVERLNQSIIKKHSYRDVKHLLKEAQIEPSQQDLDSFFLETRQVTYYSLISNNCLKTYLGKRIIHRKNRGDSTTHLLKILDKELYNSQSVSEKKSSLINNLSKLNLTLSDGQLDDVIMEAQAYRQGHGFEQVEQALEEFNTLSQSVINADHFKQQFACYQWLLENAYKLDSYDKAELITEWQTVISSGHFGSHACNPYLSSVDRLIKIRELLLAHQSRESRSRLDSKINKALRGLQSPSIINYVQTRHAIQQWLDAAKRDSTAPTVSIRTQGLGVLAMAYRFFRRFYGVGRVLHQTRLRSKNYLLKISIDAIKQRVETQLNPLDQARKSLIQEPMPLSDELLGQVPRNNKDQLVQLAPKWASFFTQARQTCEQISNDFLLAKAIERELHIDEHFTKKHQKMMNQSGLSQRFVFFRHWTQSVTSHGGHAPKLPDDMNEDQYSLTKKYFEKLAGFGDS